MARVLHRGGEYLRQKSRWWKRLLSSEAGRYAAGAKGEALVARELERLSHRFWVLHDVHVPDRAANVDHVVVGPRGVAAVETKYYAAEVRGQEGGDWQRRKPRRGIRGFWGGGWSYIHDPTAQVRRGAERLATRLARRPELWDLAETGRLEVHPVVVFAHPKTKLRVRTQRVRVVKLGKLRRTVRSIGPRSLLRREDRKRVAESLLDIATRERGSARRPREPKTAKGEFL